MDNEKETSESAPQTEAPPAPKAETPLPKPVCPYCGDDPVKILGRTFNVGRFKFMLPFCANMDCRKLIPAILLDVAEPMIQTAGEIPPGVPPFMQ